MRSILGDLSFNSFLFFSSCVVKAKISSEIFVAENGQTYKQLDLKSYDDGRVNSSNFQPLLMLLLSWAVPQITLMMLLSSLFKFGD